MFKGKFGLVTGGADGIGLEYVKELLLNEIQGVTIVDINDSQGKKVEENLKNRFGYGKVIFICADVSQKDELKSAFETSFIHWKKLDIVINNAGIANEEIWEKTIDLNCGGTVHGTLLGFQYMSKLKGGNGGVIVNISSIAGTETPFFAATYSATKSFIISYSRALGSKQYYEHNQVKVLTICPGRTDTEILSSLVNSFCTDFCPNVCDIAQQFIKEYKTQSSLHVAKNVINLIDKAENGSVWVIEDEEPPYQLFEYKKFDMRKKPS